MSIRVRREMVMFATPTSSLERVIMTYISCCGISIGVGELEKQGTHLILILRQFSGQMKRQIWTYYDMEMLDYIWCGIAFTGGLIMDGRKTTCTNKPL